MMVCKYTGKKPLIGIVLTLIGKVLLPVPLKLIYGLRIIGRKNLNKVKYTGVITVSNHCLYIEPAFTGLALWNRQVWYIVEEQNIVRRDVGWLNKLLGAVGIPSNAPQSIVRTVKQLLQTKRAVHFFPEGKLFYQNTRIKPYHRGAFFCAVTCNVPVLPVTEVLTERKLSGVFPFLPPKVCIVIGKPVFPEQIRTWYQDSRPSTRTFGLSNYFAAYIRTVMQKTIDTERNKCRKR